MQLSIFVKAVCCLLRARVSTFITSFQSSPIFTCLCRARPWDEKTGEGYNRVRGAGLGPGQNRKTLQRLGLSQEDLQLKAVVYGSDILIRYLGS